MSLLKHGASEAMFDVTKSSGRTVQYGLGSLLGEQLGDGKYRLQDRLRGNFVTTAVNH